MLSWKQNQHGTTALFIRGTRRVGKSSVAKEFARHEYESYILVDFSKATPAIHRLFEDVSNLDYIFTQLQLNYRTSLKPRKSVIIFDEIQKQPLARQAIKTLVADGCYDYIETGSLLSTENVIYQKLLSDKLKADVGYVYENVVSQIQTAAGNKLYYHTWPTPSGKHNYEKGFLLSRNAKICPIEAKSSTSNLHVSIDEFQKKFSARIQQRYLLHSKDIRKEQDLILLQFICQCFFRCKSANIITDDTVKIVTGEHRVRNIH